MSAAERVDVVTMKGNPVTLVGPALKVGDAAPDFEALRCDLSPVRLQDLRGKTVLISAVPSIDTSVCHTQTKRFNQEAASLPDTVVLAISMDLPFAQKRWCEAEGADNIIALSDHRDASFGLNYGVLIKEVRLLARSVFVVGPDGKLKHVQIVPEATDHPDYDSPLAAVRG